MKTKYDKLQAVLVIERGRDNTYGAFHLGIPGCIAVGDTREEVIEAFYRAAALHLGLDETKEARDLARLVIEIEQEEDGRWLAEIPSIPGALCYGESVEQAAQRAQALALAILVEGLEDTADIADMVEAVAALRAGEAVDAEAVLSRYDIPVYGVGESPETAVTELFSMLRDFLAELEATDYPLSRSLRQQLARIKASGFL